MGGDFAQISEDSLVFFFAKGDRWEGSSGQGRVAAKPNASARGWTKKRNQREKTTRWFPVHQMRLINALGFVLYSFVFSLFLPVSLLVGF